MDMLSLMHENGRTGSLTGTEAELARMCRATRAEMTRALKELKASKSATVTVRNADVTVTNRRMSREHKLREQARLRQKRHRQHPKNGSRHGNEQECHNPSSVTVTVTDTNTSKVIEREREGFLPENSLSETFLAELQARPEFHHKNVSKIAAKYRDHQRAKNLPEDRGQFTVWCHNERAEERDESSTDRIARVVASLSRDH